MNKEIIELKECLLNYIIVYFEKRGDLDIFSEKSLNCLYLENVGYVFKVEDVMEFDCCW